MKQTAVDYLFEKLWTFPRDKWIWQNYLEKAKEMQKEQIKDSYKEGAGDIEIQYSDLGEIHSEKYYQETYGKDT